MRRIGVLMSLAADDPQGPARAEAFLQGLQQLGWTDNKRATETRLRGWGERTRTRESANEPCI